MRTRAPPLEMYIGSTKYNTQVLALNMPRPNQRRHPFVFAHATRNAPFDITIYDREANREESTSCKSEVSFNERINVISRAILFLFCFFTCPGGERSVTSVLTGLTIKRLKWGKDYLCLREVSLINIRRYGADTGYLLQIATLVSSACT